MKRFLCLVGLFIYILSPVFSQDGKSEKDKKDEKIESNASNAPNILSWNPQIALSSPDYRVTAGDIYTLSYAAGGNAVTYRITVDSTYRIRISNLGVINAAGKTFQQLKTEAEAIVSNNYPLSGVQLVLTQPATFTVYMNGEVQEAMELTAWALTRLSALVNSNLTDYSSIRDVSVTSLNGQTRTYDLYKAVRFGDLGHNPYVRPGDIIKINRIQRVVTISGAVERPGIYQLLSGENLSELIRYYSSGLTPLADTSRMELVRHVESSTDSGDKRYLSGQDIETNYVLQNLDTVYIPVITDLIPVMFVEGAVWVSEEGAVLDTSTRLTVRFNIGENYASLVQRNQTWFSATSDTLNAYLIRGEEHIPMNLNPMLYDSAYRSPYNVQANDVLIVPFRQYFVTVAGAVNVPGRYPYIPDRGWDYYVALAGGFNPNLNARESITIVDLTGKHLTKGDPVTPETIITANVNSGLYYFNQYASVVITVFSIISTLISVFLIVSQ
jgi:protein involved in polysaccharide export with SLBB domain